MDRVGIFLPIGLRFRGRRRKLHRAEDFAYSTERHNGGSGGGGVSLSASPAAETRAINHRLTLTAQVSGTANTAVNWNVNGTSGGSLTYGLICVLASNACAPVTAGNAKQPLGLGIIRLTLQIPAAAAPSARTLFIQNTNLDKTAASGTLWIN